MFIRLPSYNIFAESLPKYKLKSVFQFQQLFNAKQTQIVFS